MASSSFIVFLLLSVTISSSLLHQIHARESQFFSKVSSKPTETVVLPDKEQEQRSLVKKQETEQQPEFVPQNQDGYGLYGHETGLFPPETESENKAGVLTESGGSYGSEKYYNNDKNGGFTEQFENSNGERFYANNGEKFDSSAETQKDDLLNFDDAFNSEKDNNGETFYSKNGVGTEHYTTESQTQKDNNGDTYYNADRKDGQFGSQLGQTKTYYNDNRFDNGFTNELNSRYNAYRTTQSQNRGESNAERKGMSDTRFLENGRYFYDLNKEQNTYNPNYKSNEFETRAYQGNEVVGSTTNYNDNNNFYDNSGAEKYEFNTMEEYEKSRLNQYDP